MVWISGNKVVVILYFMGFFYFLYFLKWVEVFVFMGGGGGFDWVVCYIKVIMNIVGFFLGVFKVFVGIFFVEVKDIVVVRYEL